MKKSFILLVFLLFSIFFFSARVHAEENTVSTAPDFTATDENGVTFSLRDYQGTVVILHFTGVETPLCIECLEEMEGQIHELENLVKSSHNVSVITINIRKNPSSVSGREMAVTDFGANISWHWVEDFSPYPIAGLYQKQWSVDGAFSNPSLIFIDMNQSIVGVYHVYCMGKGPLDGIQSAESLAGDAKAIANGTWKGSDGNWEDEGITFAGIFLLGILTSVTPCSLALLVAMISYVGSLQKDSEKKLKKYSLQGLWIGIIFTLGMSLVFFVFGMILSSVGVFIEASTVFFLIAGVILIILGINIFKPFSERLTKKSDGKIGSRFVEKGQELFLKLSKKSIYLGAFFLGILFSIGWAPCALSLMMPVFILTLTQKISILMGGLLLFVFGLGHGVPIIPLCTVTSSIRGKLGNRYVTAGKWMQRIFGIIIIAIGVIMAIRFWGIKFW
ncbi:MAG TPA: cytochrome c biogenesis protein CcdA [Candidatus Thermoplasmatota archaeon]|nr:cytochrome c biogenesis protein CcdA [Candidatus Thermoplasmatota archaeon]